MQRKRVALEIEPGAVLKRYSKAESRKLAQQWLAAFGVDARGANTKAYLWHVFSFERYASASKNEARKLYEQQIAPTYIVLTNDQEEAIETDALASWCSHADFYVSPPNFAWTMAFTHEDGWLGPYFAMHQHYDALHQANLAQIQKNQEIELAKQEGWL